MRSVYGDHRGDVKTNHIRKQRPQSLPEYPCLLSIPGFGPGVSAQVLGALGNPYRFENHRQVLKMAGLDLSCRGMRSVYGDYRGDVKTNHIRKQRPYLPQRSGEDDVEYLPQGDRIAAQGEGEEDEGEEQDKEAENEEVGAAGGESYTGCPCPDFHIFLISEHPLGALSKFFQSILPVAPATVCPRVVEIKDGVLRSNVPKSQVHSAHNQWENFLNLLPRLLPKLTTKPVTLSCESLIKTNVKSALK